jgi:hypothetical protein
MARVRPRWSTWSAATAATLPAVAYAAKADPMDEPTDPLARQLALTALPTEHFNLQSARMGTIAEANGRSTLYLGTLSSAVIAIAFVGQASQLGDSFYLFALTLLPPVFLLGLFSYLRLVQTSIEDLVYAVGSFRIRQYVLGLDPAVVPFFPPTGPEGVKKLARIGALTSSPLQVLLTAASMVVCINAIMGGMTMALALRSLLAAGGIGAGGRDDRRGGGVRVGRLVLRLPGPAHPAGGGGGPGAVRGPEPDLPGWPDRVGQRDGYLGRPGR